MQYTSTDITKLAKAEKNARKKLRLLAIAHFLETPNRTQIASMLRVSRRSVNNWVASFLQHGLDGLEAKKPKGRTCYLDQSQKQQLSTFIEQAASQSNSGGRLTGEDIHQYIETQFGISYHPNAIYQLLKFLGFSWITSRSRHPKQSQEVQDEFKKTTE